jgi:hypothetical protein
MPKRVGDVLLELGYLPIFPLLWSRSLPDGGKLTWMPGDLRSLPACCLCDGALSVTLTDDHVPTEALCSNGHRWRSALAEIRAHIAAWTPPPSDEAALCGACAELGERHTPPRAAIAPCVRCGAETRGRLRATASE